MWPSLSLYAESMVIDQNMTDVFIGRPLLQSIGFHLDQFLAKLVEGGRKLEAASSLPDSANSEQQEAPKFAALSYKGYGLGRQTKIW